VKNNYFFNKQFSNIYKKSSKNSEVTSQILYGEKFQILLKHKSWIKIKTSFDNYSGYIKNRNYTDRHFSKYKVYALKASIFDKLQKKTKNFLPFGSKISLISKNKNYIEFEKNKWIKKKDVKNINHKEKKFIKIFKLFLKTKYVWGGKTFKGIDCSALLQLFYYYNRSFYPRDTIDQIKYSKKNQINKFEFKNKENNPIFYMIRYNNFFFNLKSKIKKNPLLKILNIKNENNLLKNQKIKNNYNLVINCNGSNFINKNFFFRKINKKYNAVAFTTIIKHKKFSNNIRIIM